MPDLLQVEALSAGYGEAVVLSDISLGIADGQALALLGRNGTGKTTLINTLVGLTTRHAGSIKLDGRDITRARPEARVRAGIGWSPQERNIFKSLTVEENLTAIARPGAWTLARVFDMFPRLAERRANLGSQLSGGEQQMLAIGRALMANPKLLLLDEPSLGLAPKLVRAILEVVRAIRARGTTVLLVEQNARMALETADRAYVLETGTVALAGPAAEMAEDERVQRVYLGGGV